MEIVKRLAKTIADRTPPELKFRAILWQLANDEINVKQAIDRINELDKK